MRRYLSYSFALHVLLAMSLLIVGALRSKPQMSYYSVDLFTSMPAGATASSPVATSTPPPPVPQERPAPVAPKEAIRVADKRVKRQPPPSKSKPVSEKKVLDVVKKPTPKRSLSDLMYGNTDSPAATHSVSGGISGSANVVAQAGASFPYPWYLKTVADRVDKQWKPPHEFSSDTVCQIVFTIYRDGKVAEQKIEKSSSDSFFDQLSLRAVLYSNPLPPLPEGFPGDSLRVHLKFMGKE